MNILGFRPYKKLNDDELLERVYSKIETLHHIDGSNNDEDYWKEVMLLNDMIIETKKRNLKINNETLFKNILI